MRGLTVSDVGLLSLPAVTDSFGRADSSTTLGSTDGGRAGPTAWIAHSGTWGIDAGRACLVSATSQAVASIDTGCADVSITVDITLGVNPSDTGVVFRVIDNNNYLLVVVERSEGGFGNANTITLYKRDGGTFTSLAQLAKAGNSFSTTYQVKVVAVGAGITVYRDGVQKLTHTLSAANQTKYGTQTRHGLRLNGMDSRASRFDNLVIRTA